MLQLFKQSHCLERMNQLTQIAARYKRRGAGFKKRLGVYSFKLKRPQYYKNHHAIPLHKREKLMKAKSHVVQRISEAERESTRPFGRHTSKGRFHFNVDLVPFYDVPDLTGFKLLPYVPHTTPKIPEDKFEHRMRDIPDHIKELQLSPEETLPSNPDDGSSPSAGAGSRY